MAVLKKKGLHKNMNNTVFNSNLENDSVVFNIGSHLIAIYIPTVVEDFYDLPSYSEVWLMFKNRSHFYTSMSDKGDKSIEGTNFNTWLDQYFAWGCLYDIWKSAVSIKISRLFLSVGVYIIFTSIIYAFFFQAIQSL
ncbi:MAG: hypothetical protein VB070_14960 [Clostridiaceae bacterium]|nr:hypothetical protein [Clostridiaceae bacterium]